MIEQQKILRVFKLIKLLSYERGKTIHEIRQHLNIASATVYRYIRLLEELGYYVKKDAHTNRLSINTFSDVQKFTTEEKKLLVSILNTTKNNSRICHTILAKIKAFDIEFSPQALQSIHKIKIADMLVFAAQSHKSIIIRGYKSTRVEAPIRDRHVIAIDYNPDKQSALCYDIESKEYKIFKLSRMADVDIVMDGDTLSTIEDLPQLDKFGWSGTKPIFVKLQMTSRARALLIEDFPNTEMHISKVEESIMPYLYEDHVYGYEGIGRFVLGLLTEIKVVSNEDFKKYLVQKLNKNTLFT